MLRLSSIEDSTYAPYSRTNQELTGEVEPMLNVLGAKNLLPNNATSQIVNNVTYTVNSDGSVKVNGTASRDADLVLGYNIPVKNWFQKEGEYLLSFGDELQGEPGNEILSGYIAIFDNSKTPRLQLDKWCIRTNPVQSFTITKEMIESNTTWIQCLVRVWSGKIVSNRTVYPMIRPASIQDDTYVPYAMTNRELTLVNMPFKKVSQGTDLNNLKENGFYTLYCSTNAPFGGQYYNIWIQKFDDVDNYLSQVAIGMDDNKMAHRICNGGVWSAWKSVATS
jgi:hypothetical protein